MSEHLDPPSVYEARLALRTLMVRNPDTSEAHIALRVLEDLIGEYGALQEAKAMLVIQIEEMEREMPDD